MCYADLINADNMLAAQGGTANGGIVFDFAAFAFSDSPSQVSMVINKLIITKIKVILKAMYD